MREKVTLTRFMDFVNASGMDREKVVRETINTEKYSPCKDFYKDIRDAIVSFFENKGTLESLEEEIALVKDEKKMHYLSLLQGFENWIKSRKIVFLGTESCDFELSGLGLSINPELLLEINGEKTIVKLFFKDKRIKRNTANMISVLMEMAFSVFETKYDDYNFAVLDLRNGKLFRITPSTPVEKIQFILNAEAKNWLEYQSEIQKG